MALTSLGAKFETTETTPSPPSAKSGKVKPSSPDKTAKLGCLALTFARTSAIWLMLPLASLTPMMLGKSAMRAKVSVAMLVPVRP